MSRVLAGSVALRGLLALLGGYLVYLSFPPRPLWFLAPVGVAALVLVLRGRSARAGFGYGYLGGLGFFVPLLPWVGEYVGAVPWLALAAAEAVAVGLFGAVAAVVGRLPGAPLWVAVAWVAAEGLRARVPFDGFPWGQLAFGQSDGLLLPLASVAGAPGLSFAMALIGTGLAWLVLHLRAGHLRGACRRAVVGAAAAVLVPVLLALALTPGVRATNTSDTTRTVAVVQGNVPRLGLDFNAQRAAVLNNHVARTEQLAADVAAGRAAQPAFVLWPENASDIDPLRNPDAAEAITRAARAVRAPIVLGTVLSNGDGTSRNTVLVWDPVTGPGQQHDKRILQPFGEYIPYRDFFSRFSSYAELAGSFVPGDGNGVLTAAGVPLAVATCYEVLFDELIRESVRAGAQLIAVPTNNATFGDTEMTYQQLAMSQVRAVEHGRAVLVAATSGVSAVISPDGTVTQATEIFAPDALVAQVPLRSTTTLATRLGAGPEIALGALALAALGAAVLRGRNRNHTRSASGEEDEAHDGAPAPALG